MPSVPCPPTLHPPPSNPSKLRRRFFPPTCHANRPAPFSDSISPKARVAPLYFSPFSFSVSFHHHTCVHRLYLPLFFSLLHLHLLFNTCIPLSVSSPSSLHTYTSLTISYLFLLLSSIMSNTSPLSCLLVMSRLILSVLSVRMSVLSRTPLLSPYSYYPRLLLACLFALAAVIHLFCSTP